jgi:cob(I)alamin adenosyltransferase
MPRLTRLYTRTGDEGLTGLGGGQRVAKDDARVEAYGTVDELNACLGLALATGLAPRLGEVLPPIQNELFHLGTDLCFLEEDKARLALPRVEQRHVNRLEQMIDELNADVGPLANFVLPGGSPGAAHLHLARTVCRRAERAIVSLARHETIAPLSLAYLNRLSDLLFVMARYENKHRGLTDPLWDSHA